MKWEHGFDHLKHVQYALIREWRVKGCTWRRIAEKASEAWNGDWDSNQMAGVELCEAAAKHFGEDPHSEPWN